MTGQLSAPPVLSTPETHIFEDPTPPLLVPRLQRLADAELQDVYEISRTAREIREGGWKRIALQFPDAMLHDAPRAFEALQKALRDLPEKAETSTAENEEIQSDSASLVEAVQELDVARQEPRRDRRQAERLYILADTSYGACCVDEIAAEHVDAEVVVHYGRSCLSPTARLPVIYVFTTHPLEIAPVLTAFKGTFPQRDTKVIVMADITYSNHITAIVERLKEIGYTEIFAPAIIHDPSSPLPNRTIPAQVSAGSEELKQYHLFHISEPPTSLLLTLSSRLQSMYIYSTSPSPSPTKAPTALQAQTSQLLRRRYALVTSLTTCPIFGILINTLSVANYLKTVTSIQKQIAAAGKKSYTFVVGKVNAAKVANFSEIGGWVVVGCWESSLIESTDFYRPIITPFELGLTLMSDDERIWTGEWTGDFSSLAGTKLAKSSTIPDPESQEQDMNTLQNDAAELDSEEESAPPEFDLRTGRYVSHSRPMRMPQSQIVPKIPSSPSGSSGAAALPSKALMTRARGDLATINGAASPGAEYLRSQRTWTGLGSDFEIAYENENEAKGSAVEQGRSGVARGYTVGGEEEKR